MGEDDILIYGAIRAMTGDGKAAFANQLFDEHFGKFQSELNKQFANAGVSGATANTINTNSARIEEKVNALLTAVTYLIQHVVYYSGTPYNIPQELQSVLQLQRISASSTPAMCGQAVCGQTICGII